MPRSYQDDDLYFDEDYDDGGDEIRPTRPGPEALLISFAWMLVVVLFGLPFWTAYQIGNGSFGERGLLVKVVSLSISLVAVVAIVLTFAAEGIHLLEFVIARRESEFPLSLLIVFMFRLVYLIALGVSYLVGVLHHRDTTPPQRQGGVAVT